MERGYERFDEYDGEWTKDGEFIVDERKLKKPRRETKDDRIYGVFGRDSDDDSEGGMDSEEEVRISLLQCH